MTPNSLYNICASCDKFGGKMLCSEIGTSIYPRVMRGSPFCPIGKHVDRFPPRLLDSIRIAAGGFVAGFVNLVIYALRLCAASPLAKKKRHAECLACEYRKTWLGLIDICGVCKCWLQAKQGNANQSCPAGKWGREKRKNCFDGTSLPVIGSMMPKQCGGCGHAS